LIILFYFLVIYNKQSKLMKFVLGASCVTIKGGFEGLGDPEIEEQNVTPKPRRSLNSSLSKTAMVVERDSLSLSATQLEYQRQREDSKGTMTEVNPEGKAVPIPIQTGIGTSSRFMGFKYLMGIANPCPWGKTPTPPLDLPSLPLSLEEAEPEHSNTSEANHTIKKVRFNDKKVRFNDIVEVVEIERVEQNLETNNKKFYISSKSSNSEASPNLISHGQGQINNPASDSDVLKHLKDLNNKFK
jgi:hypothetical protein